MKKFLAIILTIMLILSVCPFGAFNLTASAATSGYYTYTVSNGEATITDCSTSISGDVTIPSTLGGYPVTCIGSSAFYECSSLTAITIPYSVTSIGYYAFYNCSALTSITIPDGVTSIGNYAFEYCSALKSVYITDIAAWCNIKFRDSYANPMRYAENLYLNGKLLTKIEIPDGVTSIGHYAFSNCTSLTSITIPDSVTSIGSYAFSNCTSLTSITIPDSVTSIGRCAFYYCSSLTSITIPESVTSIGVDAFEACSSLKSVYITDVVAWCNIEFPDFNSNPLYNAKNLYLNGELVTELLIPDSVTRIGNNTFLGCTSLTQVIIPDSVTSIGDNAFRNCSSLISVTIPNSVTSIGWSVFYGCSKLTSITIPDSVTSIGNYAFEYCSALTSITIPDGVTSIGDGAFACCDSLTSITIPESVTSIGYGAFYGCSSLTTVYYCGAEQDWNKISIDNDNENLTNATINYHNYGEWNVVSEATCDQNGEKYRICSICDNVETITTLAFGHDYVNGGCTRYGCSENVITSISLSDTSITLYYENTYQLYAYYSPYDATDTTIYWYSSNPSVASVDQNGYVRFECGGGNAIIYAVAQRGSAYVTASACCEVYTVGATVSEWCSDCGMYTDHCTGDPMCPYYSSGPLPDTSDGLKFDSNGYPCSSHPYSNNMNSTITYTAYYDVYELIITFSDETYTESNYDYIYIYDENDNLVGKYCGDALAGERIVISGNSFTIRMTTDGSVTKYGFSIVNIQENYYPVGCYHYYQYECDQYCYYCGDGWRDASHYYSDNCDYYCNYCGEWRDASHYYSSDCDEYCNLCNYHRYVEFYPHTYDNNCDTSCNVCGGYRDIEHRFDNNNDPECDVCGYIRYYIYTLENDQVTITGIKDSLSGDIIIPSTLSGYPVVKIGDDAFLRCNDITSVIIPEGVETIGDWAFGSCTALSSITIPNSIIAIGDNAFYNCGALTSVTIPQGVTTIGDCAFEECTSLTAVKISVNLKNIGSLAFSGCESLNSVHYCGSKEQWNEVAIGSGNSYLLNAAYYHHNYVLINQILPTCTQSGSSTYICSVCAAEKTDEILPPGHNMAVKYICDDEQDFTDDEDYYSEHITYEVPYCTICDHTESSTYLGTVCETVVVTAPTCTESGNGYDVCSYCSQHLGDRYLDPTGHNYVNKTCTDCGDVFCAGDHTFGEWFVVTLPTCTSEGISKRICSVCGEEELESIPEIEHDIELRYECDVVYNDFGDIIPDEDENYPLESERHVSHEVYGCTKCDYIESRTEIPLSTYENITEPTCTEGGTTFVYCEICDNIIQEYYYSKLGHDYVSQNVESTCIEKGYTEHVCQRCGDNYRENHIDATGVHIYENGNCKYCDRYLESEHDYANSFDKTWNVYRKGALNITVTFSAETFVEQTFDYIYIYDANGDRIGSYTGDALASKSITVAGDTVKIRLKTDKIGTSYGFKITDISAEYPLSDLNCDGDINLLDIVKMKKIFAGINDVETKAPDLDNDGDVTADDLVILIDMILTKKKII